MNCPYCQHPDSQVIDTRQSTYNNIGGIRRRRQCSQCLRRFSSFEMTIQDLEGVEPATLDGILQQIIKIFREAPVTHYKTPDTPFIQQQAKEGGVNGSMPTTPLKTPPIGSKDIKEAMRRARIEYAERLDELDASEFKDEDFD